MAKRASAKSAEPMKQATEIGTVSVDLGNAYSNMQSDGGIAADWRSIQGRVSDSTRMDELPSEYAIMYDEAWRVFGEKAPTYATIEDFTTTERYTSKWYKRLFAYALHRAYGLRIWESPFYPHVVASIPAKEYANDARVQQVKANLVGPYMIGNVQGQTLQVEIMPEKLTVVPEGAGAYFSMLKASNQGGASSLADGLWYVLDLGYLTADIVSFRDADYMPDNASSNADLGIRYVAQKIARFVRGEGGPDLDPSHFDDQLRCDSIPVNGRQYNIKSVRDTALAELGERIARFLQREASNQNLAGVLLAGGGAELLHGYIKAPGLPAMIIVPNARRANCEGAYKLLTE